MIKKPTISINEVEYSLATTLRVAFKIQGMNEHKPYTQVFQEMAEMPVEKQIDIIYASFICANPEQATRYDKNAFRDYCLDNMNLKDMMGILQSIIQGIMGEPEESDTEAEDEKN